MTNVELGEPRDRFTVPAADRFLVLLLLAEVLLIAATWPLWTTIDRFPPCRYWQYSATCQ